MIVIISRTKFAIFVLVLATLLASCSEPEAPSLQSIESNFMASCANSVDDEIETDPNLELDDEAHVDICQCVSDSTTENVSQEDLADLNENLAIEDSKVTLSKEIIDIVAQCAIDVMSL